MTLTVKRMGKNWWIVGDDYGPMGPYETKAEADADVRGLRRWERYYEERDFITTDRRKEE